MSAIQNKNILLDKKSQCDTKGTKSEAEIVCHVKTAKSKIRTNSHAEISNPKVTQGRRLLKQAESNSEKPFADHYK